MPQTKRVGANGLTTVDYVQHVVAALNGKLVELDCEDPDTGRIYLV